MDVVTVKRGEIRAMFQEGQGICPGVVEFYCRNNLHREEYDDFEIATRFGLEKGRFSYKLQKIGLSRFEYINFFRIEKLSRNVTDNSVMRLTKCTFPW